MILSSKCRPFKLPHSFGFSKHNSLLDALTFSCVPHSRPISPSLLFIITVLHWIMPSSLTSIKRDFQFTTVHMCVVNKNHEPAGHTSHSLDSIYSYSPSDCVHASSTAEVGSQAEWTAPHLRKTNWSNWRKKESGPQGPSTSLVLAIWAPLARHGLLDKISEKQGIKLAILNILLFLWATQFWQCFSKRSQITSSLPRNCLFSCNRT